MAIAQDLPVFSDKAAQILQGAMQEFLRHGYAGTSMDKVAATAKVSKPTVYNHFQDKEGLFKALIRYVAQQRCHKIMGDGPLQGDPQVVLRQIALEALKREINDPEYLDFIRLVIGESGRFPGLAQTFLESLTKPTLEQLTAYLSDRAELHIADPEGTARVLLGAVVFFSLTQGIMHGQTVIPFAPERLVDSMMQLITQAGPVEGASSSPLSTAD